jgi:hypothetical protein
MGSVRQGTASCSGRVAEPHDPLAMRALAEGQALRGTGRIGNIARDTVCAWLDRAGRHWRAVTSSLFDTLSSTEGQVDDLWSVVRTQEAHLTVAATVLAL